MTNREFKVIIVGDSGVGKTSFAVRFVEEKFLNVYDSTVGVDCKKIVLQVQNQEVELHLWDTAGQERFKSIVSRFYRAADGAVVMYDVTNKSTFDNVPWWVEDVNRNCPNIPIVLVGNKNDDARQIEVLEELAQDFAEANQLYLYHSSARDNLNVAEVFRGLTSAMIAEDKNNSVRGGSRNFNGYSSLRTRDFDVKVDNDQSHTDDSYCCGHFLKNVQKPNLVI